MYSHKTRKTPRPATPAPKSVTVAAPDASPDHAAQLARQEMVERSATAQLKGHDKKLYLNIEATVDGETKKYRDVPMAELKSHPGKTDYDTMALEYVKGLEGADSVIQIVGVKTFSRN